MEIEVYDKARRIVHSIKHNREILDSIISSGAITLSMETAVQTVTFDKDTDVYGYVVDHYQNEIKRLEAALKAL